MRSRDIYFFNAQDNPEFWFQRYNMMFPPNFLHNRLSAHYIEINHIFGIEMMKKYQIARQNVLAERDMHSDEVKRTKYATNANYVYEPFGSRDADAIQRMKDQKTFWGVCLLGLLYLNKITLPLISTIFHSLILIKKKLKIKKRWWTSGNFKDSKLLRSAQ